MADERFTIDRAARLKRAYLSIIEQVEWIVGCGGSRAGYIARYGKKSDDDHLGDGGDAIWEADYRELQRLKERADAI